MGEILQLQLDWPHLHRLAYCNGQLPALARRLAQFKPEAVPPDTMQMLRGFVASLRRQNQTLLAMLLELLERFERSGIEAWPFLESYFSLAAYEDLDRRPCHWMDFLIRPESLAATREILRPLGWRELPSAGGDGASILNSGALDVLGPKGEGLALQWATSSVAHGVKLILPEVFHRPALAVFQGHQIQTLAAEDVLLHACVRYSHDLWTTLAYVCDVAQVVHAHPGLHWGEVTERARRTGTLRMLLVGLRLANALLGCTLPERVVQCMQGDRRVEALAVETKRRLLDSVPGTNRTPQTLRFHLLVRERLSDRLGYLWRFLITPTQVDMGLFRLPGRLRSLYALLRPARLAGSTVRHLLDRPLRKLLPRPRKVSGYSPSEMAVVQRMLELANVGPGDVVYDLGCGDGRIVIEAAQRFGARGVGFDLDPERIRESRENARRAGVDDRAVFHLQDAMSADFSEATVVTLYLPPQASLQLAPKLMQSLPSGARVVSHNIALGEWDLVEACESGEHPSLIYLYRVKAAAQEPATGAEQTA